MPHATAAAPALPRSTDLRTLLGSMWVIRRFEETVLELRRAEEINGSVHTCVGQEIVPLAVSAHLGEHDRVLSTYRGHGWALASGVPVAAVFGEMMGRAEGTNGGRGGSAYLSSPEHGFLGENSIVAAGMPIANGVAMALEARGDSGIAVVSIGDGATNQGAAHEALVFANARSLPVLFVCENNSWSEMTPIAETVPEVELHARVAAMGISVADVDGADVEALMRQAQFSVEFVRRKRRPFFLEVTVPRILGHYNGDIEHYRSAADRAEHAERDPIVALERVVVQRGLGDEDAVGRLRENALALVEGELEVARAMAPADPASATDHVVSDAPASPPRAPSPGSAREMKYGLAVNHALMLEMAERPEIVMFGEDIATAGGTFGVTRNLRKQYGERVFDTPIAEAAILGAAVGASIEGLRPVVEVMWSDFLFVAFDQVINQAANVRYLNRGKLSAPLVVRTQQGMTPGSCAQHSQSIEALLAHIPGIRVGVPATPGDAFAMTRAAIASPDPVVMIESRRLYLDSGLVDVDAEREAVGGARVARPGSDVLIVTWGTMLAVALEAAERLSDQGVQATVLDVRWISPLDTATLFDECRRNGMKAVIVHEANLTSGFGAEITARLVEEFPGEVGLRVRRVALPDTRVPAAEQLQSAVRPAAAQVASVARGILELQIEGEAR